LRSLFPISGTLAAAIISVMIAAFIFSGGIKSYAAVGNAKTAALYLLLVVCCVKAVSGGYTVSALLRVLPRTPWFSLFGFGTGKALGACLSLIVGIVCTQIYVQAVFSASGEREARTGCLVSALFIPPIGLMGTWLGLSLRAAGVEIDPAQALPYFILNYFHPAVGGALWAFLAIAVVGGAAGLCLGVATNVSIDVFLRFARVDRGDIRALWASRASVLLTIAVSAALGMFFEGALILHLSYIGMGLRGAAMFVPMSAAILRPGLISRRAAFASSFFGLAAMLAVWFFLPDMEPLFIGLLASAIAAILWAILDLDRAHEWRASYGAVPNARWLPLPDTAEGEDGARGAGQRQDR
jgi:SSS family solute:Na+ symporter